MTQNYDKLTRLDQFKTLFSLEGKTGLILGGAGKLGSQFSKILSEAGASLIVVDSNAENLKRVSGKSTRTIECDVTDLKALDEVFKGIPKLDFFIHNVMSKPKGYYDKTTAYTSETWDEIFQANVRSAFFAARKASNLMQANGGSMIFTASIYGFLGPDQRIYKDCKPSGNPYFKGASLNAPAAYSASKGALLSMTKHLATEFAPSGIRVNALIPGGVWDSQEESFHKNYCERTPLGRMAHETDYNGAVVFLASDASRYMTGANLIIDGGWSAW